MKSGKARIVAGARKGQASMGASGNRKRDSLIVRAPLRYQQKMRELCLTTAGLLRARVSTGFSEGTVLKIMAGVGISPGTFARLLLLFDGPDAAEKYLAFQRTRDDARGERYARGVYVDLDE